MLSTPSTALLAGTRAHCKVIISIDTRAVPGVGPMGDSVHAAGLVELLTTLGQPVLSIGIDPFRGALRVGEQKFSYMSSSPSALRATDDADWFGRSVDRGTAAVAAILGQLEGQVEIIHLNTELAWPAVNGLTVPLVYTAHVNNERLLDAARTTSAIRPLLAGLQRDCVRAADAVVVPSIEAPQWTWVRRSSQACYFIPPFEMSLEPSLPPVHPYDVPSDASNGLHAVFVGRVAHVKGILDMVRCLSDAPENLRLTVIGDGPQLADLDAASRTVPAHVVLLGAQAHEDVLELIRQADCVVVPSREESYCLVVTEALREGVPVVASDLPAFHDRVLDGVNGMLVPGGPRPCAQALVHLGSQPEALAQLRGGAARCRFVDNRLRYRYVFESTGYRWRSAGESAR